MSNPTSSRTDGSPELSPAPAPQEQLPPRLPLGFDASSSGGVSPDDIANSAVDNLAAPHPLNERDIELIDFLVQKAIEKCMPARPQPPLPPGVRLHAAKRKSDTARGRPGKPAESASAQSAASGATSNSTPSTDK